MIHQKIQLFEDREDVTLTTYVLDDSKEMLNGKCRPAVLVIPGGGYLYCSDREGEPIALSYAQLGYHAFVLKYSVGLKQGMVMQDVFNQDISTIEMNMSAQYPTPMNEVGKAILTIREHAGEWHINTTRIALCGFSAGAHLTAMYGNALPI